MKKYCISCGNAVKCGPQCNKCATKERWKNPTKKMLEAQIIQIKIFQKSGTDAEAKLPRTEKQLDQIRKLGLKYGRITLTKNFTKWKKEHPEFNKGENHPNWKGGISALEFEKKYRISGEEWKILAQDIWKRDKFVCQYCGKKNSTSVHHIIPARINKDNHPNNLITLCQSCHPKIERMTDEFLKENRDPIEIFYEKWSK